MSFTHRNPVEITGNLIVHHPVKEQAKTATVVSLGNAWPGHGPKTSWEEKEERRAA